MNNFRDALIVGLCVFDIRMGEDGFEADGPCDAPCEYCSAQADFLLSLMKVLGSDQQPVESIIERIESLEANRASITEFKS